MEDIYTIKVKTNPDPRDLYPSERRYSASTVLGLSVVHLALAVTTLLLASLSLTTHTSVSTDLVSNYSVLKAQNVTVDHKNDDVAFLGDETESEVQYTTVQSTYDKFINLTLLPCVMSLGALAAGLTGLLAWKRWYVDQNIKWFFFMSSVSTLTSLSCLTLIALTIGTVTEQHYHTSMMSDGLDSGNAFIFSFNNNNVYVDRVDQNTASSTPTESLKKTGKMPNFRIVLAINILIAAILEFMWSVLSTRVSWRGMRNGYPEDIVISRGKIEVNTVHKGKKNKMIAPDILNHHPTKRKFAKYFPKKEDSNLPKIESNAEYRERVNKFLSSNINET